MMSIRELPICDILGNQANVDELLEMLRVIESSNFAELPKWRSKTRRMDGKEFSPGRRGPGADWVYYDPWKKTKIDRETAEHRAFLRI